MKRDAKKEEVMFIYKLTDAEWKLIYFALVCKSTESQVLAEPLCLSPHTIDRQFKSLFVKLNVGSRSEIFLKAIDEDWFVPDGKAIRANTTPEPDPVTPPPQADKREQKKKISPV